MSTAESITGPRVVYVYGTGRNGSTLLGQILGSRNCWVHVGEIVQVWGAGMIDNCVCECGARFSSCDFWGAVIAQAGLTHADAIDAVQDLQASCRTLHAPRALVTNPWPSRDVELRLRERTVRLYNAIARVSGAYVIVDTSKLLTYGALVSTGFQTVGVYLVRDPRAVAYSWEHAKPDPSRGEGGMMDVRPTWRSAVIWQAFDALTHPIMARFSMNSMTLTYEDLVDDRDETVREISSRIDSGCPDISEFPAAGTVGHSIAGNPIRFDSGPLEMRRDTRWLSDRSLRREAIVDILCAGGMVRHGYPLVRVGRLQGS